MEIIRNDNIELVVNWNGIRNRWDQEKEVN